MGQVKASLVVLAGFSLVINLLLLASPIYMLQVYDRVLTTGHLETLALITIMASGALLLLGLIDGLRSVIMARMGSWFNERLAPLVMTTGLRARLLGDTAGAQPMRDLAQIQAFLSSQGLTALFDAPWTPIFLLLIWMLHPALGTFAVAASCAIVVLGLVNEWLTRRSLKSSNEAQIVAMQSVDAVIRNAEVVRAMGMLPGLTKRWQTVNELSQREALRGSQRSAVILGLTKFLRLFVQSAMLGLASYFVIKGEATGGVMIASSILLSRALAPLELMMGSWRSIVATHLAFNRLRGRLENIPPEPRRTRLPAPYGFLTLERVSVSLPGLRAPVLSAVGLALTPGEVLAVIGPSASGKSMLCRVVTGVLKPTDGMIRLDGTELSHWDPDQLGRVVGYLPQDVELFAGTVRDNIARMGDADDEDVVQAALLAQAHEMIQRLPQGYQTPIGEGGARLSGGQRQRIGLARAVFGSPRLVILDEPNANLDQSGEIALAAAIQELKRQNAAVVIVGHRPSTLAQADKVMLLAGGKVELLGPRDEVIARLRGAGNARKAPVKMQEQVVAPEIVEPEFSQEA